MKKQLRLQLAIVVLLLAGLTGCSSVTAPVQSILQNQPVAAQNSTAPAVAAPAPAPAVAPQALSKNETMAAIESNLADIYSRVNPSVVSIQVTQKATQVNQQTLPDLPGFRFFFGQPQLPQGQAPQDFYRHGAGSGFVWDQAGHIVTNNHVVEGADKITVTFVDGTTATATVVGTDSASDLAVLKVDVPTAELQPVTLGDSTKVNVGQLAVAIGNPFGLENTMTVGFVSALGRVLPASSGQDQSMLGQLAPTFTIPDIIQTDAPINPGNSGGVLVNDQAEVIGVTAAIESPVRASAGIGFAIPSVIVQKVVPALIQNGQYQHTWLGLSGGTLTPDLATAMNLPANQQGALVVEVTPGGPADQAGLHGSDRQVTIEGQQVPVGGDVIVAIDGQPIKNFDSLVAYLALSTSVNQKVTLTVLRQGKEIPIEVTLAARPESQTNMNQPIQTTGNGPKLGIQGITLTPDIATAMNLPADQQGVLVERIGVGTPADQAQLQGGFKSALINGRQIPIGGDIITAVDGQPITSLEDLQTQIQNAQPGQQVTLTILRDGQQMSVPVTLSSNDNQPAF